MRPIKDSIIQFTFQIIPFLWALFCVLLNYINISFFPNYHQSLPVVLIVIFYFSIFSPHRLNIFSVFFLGLISDFFTTSTMGLHSFVFCSMFFIPNLIRSYIHRLPFFKLWDVFCLIFLFVEILWVWLFRLSSGQWVSSSFWFVQYLFTCLLYPFFMWSTGYLMKKIRVFK